MLTPITPGGLAPPAANYAHAILTEDATRWLHTSGVVPVRPDGTVAESVGEQAETVWTNIAVMLGDAAMAASDVVSVTTFVVAGNPLDAVMAARDRFLGSHRAASTLVTVPALAQPAWQVEIAIIAAN